MLTHPSLISQYFSSCLFKCLSFLSSLLLFLLLFLMSHIPSCPFSSSLYHIAFFIALQYILYPLIICHVDPSITHQSILESIDQYFVCPHIFPSYKSIHNLHAFSLGTSTVFTREYYIKAVVYRDSVLYLHVSTTSKR